ncbi:hypothetical protein OJ253_1866 [Cryptosporidium canis]|uniref:Uncharacterized protein n=1 Tax=Cryptosporidium canis TaxID=195482 RepID=A0A9D5DG68_9CRYT|nr:hypothetical protein OJ253_1866 [Cryptosporidium canis]
MVEEVGIFLREALGTPALGLCGDVGPVEVRRLHSSCWPAATREAPNICPKPIYSSTLTWGSVGVEGRVVGDAVLRKPAKIWTDPPDNVQVWRPAADIRPVCRRYGPLGGREAPRPPSDRL